MVRFLIGTCRLRLFIIEKLNIEARECEFFSWLEQICVQLEEDFWVLKWM